MNDHPITDMAFSIISLRQQIATLTAERDEIQRELRKAETESSMLRVECGMIAAERDEARRIAAYQYAKHSNYGDESFAMKNFFQFHKWEYLKEDGK
jgi:hypothetical protein